MARDIFTASPGYVLLSADYSQLELRVAAMLSGDEEMKAIYNSGVDYHLRTAQLIAPIVWHVDGATIETKGKERSFAKTVNFGLLYGKTDAGLAYELGCTRAEAEAVRRAILGRFKQLARWLRDQVAYARQHGCVWTSWLGEPARRRYIYRIADQDEAIRRHAENQAYNTPVQGSASDYCLASLIELVRWLREDAVPAKAVLTVYDSIIFECREDAVAEVAWRARDVMRGWPSFGVPLVVDFEVGTAWGSLKKYELPA
jgi:DNA polymerase-1